MNLTHYVSTSTAHVQGSSYIGAEVGELICTGFVFICTMHDEISINCRPSCSSCFTAWRKKRKIA